MPTIATTSDSHASGDHSEFSFVSVHECTCPIGVYIGLTSHPSSGEPLKDMRDVRNCPLRSGLVDKTPEKSRNDSHQKTRKATAAVVALPSSGAHQNSPNEENPSSGYKQLAAEMHAGLNNMQPILDRDAEDMLSSLNQMEVENNHQDANEVREEDDMVYYIHHRSLNVTKAGDWAAGLNSVIANDLLEELERF